MCRVISGCCWAGVGCLGLLIFMFAGAALSIGLGFAIRPGNPKCSIEKFYLPALNQSVNYNTTAPSNITTIYYNLKLYNPHAANEDSAGLNIYYDTVNLTFYYQPPNTTTNAGYYQLIANKTISEFRQCAGCTNTKEESVELKDTDGDAIFKAGLENQTVIFKVKMKTKVRFDNWFWKTKQYKIDIGANVKVNNQGIKINKKGIKLKSGAPRLDFYLLLVVGALVISFYILSTGLII